MIDLSRKLKNFGPLEFLVITSLAYVIIMLIWTASTRSAVVQKANDIKFNHKTVVEFINNEVNECSSNEKGKTSWGEKCNSAWTSSNIVKYILDNFKLNNPYKIEKPLIQTSQDPRIQAEGKAGQSTDKGIIFVSESNFESEAVSEWVIGTCVKSPCVAAGNNELVSVVRINMINSASGTQLAPFSCTSCSYSFAISALSKSIERIRATVIALLHSHF